MSLQRVFGGELIKDREAPKVAAAQAPQKEKTDRQAAAEALAHYRKAQELLRQGNWAGYGEELKKIGRRLKRAGKEIRTFTTEGTEHTEKKQNPLAKKIA